MSIPRKILHPIFGSHCRTQSFADKTARAGTSRHIYAEAYLDDPIAKTWTVCEVTMTSNPSLVQKKDAKAYASRKIKSGVNFAEAVEILSVFENGHRQTPQSYTPLYPEPAHMGTTHYKNFAECEGYVFDKNGLPHARPWPDVLPSGPLFLGEDVESARKNLRRPREEFDNNGPSSKIPNTSFIFDAFSRAAQRHTFDEGVAATRMLSLLDKFVNCVDDVHNNLKDYCANYEQLGKGELVSQSLLEVARAESALRQLKAYGLETREFETFLEQTKITCMVLHAQGLYGLMRKGLGDYSQNEELFMRRMQEAADAYRKTGASERQVVKLKEMTVQSAAPDVPASIGLFIIRYKQKRGEYANQPPPASPPPPAP